LTRAQNIVDNAEDTLHALITDQDGNGLIDTDNYKTHCDGIRLAEFFSFPQLENELPRLGPSSTTFILN
jgi:hypothetical protein